MKKARTRILSCFLAALILLSLPLVTASAYTPYPGYDPDWDIFDTGGPFFSIGILSDMLCINTVNPPSYMAQISNRAQLIMPKIGNQAAMNEWAALPSTADWMAAWLAEHPNEVTPTAIASSVATWNAQSGRMNDGDIKTASDFDNVTTDPKVLVAYLFFRTRVYAETMRYPDGAVWSAYTLQFLNLPEPDYFGIAVQGNYSKRAQIIAQALAYGVNAVEDYMGWAVIEQEEGVLDFSPYRENIDAIKAAGLYYIPKLWMQNAPSWFFDQAEWATNALTGATIPFMSIYSQSTLDAYRHYYQLVADEFGDDIDALRITPPYDFGETMYPCGVSENNAFNYGAEMGFWVGEESAREHFRNWMAAKYGAISALNTAWGTGYNSFSEVEYPDFTLNHYAYVPASPDPLFQGSDAITTTANDRHLLDFVAWYHEGLVDQMSKILDMAQEMFPDKPININIGLPHEKIAAGQDLTGLVKLAAEKDIVLRTPTSKGVMWLYTKRISTALKLYDVKKAACEPVDASPNVMQMAEAYYKDLTSGITWHKDFGAVYQRASMENYIAPYTEISSLLQGEYPIVDVALFYPTTSHYLYNWNTWYTDMALMPHPLCGGFIEGLLQYAEQLRDFMDYDVLDERLVADGFLSEYKYLIWPAGRKAEAATLQKIADWVAAGGTLLVTKIDDIRTVENDQGAFADICAALDASGVSAYGDGQVIDIAGFPGTDVGSAYADLRAKYPGYNDGHDNYFTSEFENGFLLFNKGAGSKNLINRYGFSYGIVSVAQYRFMYFAKEFYDLTVNTSACGTITGTAGGSYEPGMPINLSAEPSKGWVLKGWLVNGDLIETSGDLTCRMGRGGITVEAVYELGDPVAVDAAAFVTKQSGNKNDLTITIVEVYADGSEVVFTETFSIDNNAAGTYEIGGYAVYVDTKGNDQIRACYIVE